MNDYLDSETIITLSEMRDLYKAKVLVDIVFKDVVDKSGESYIRHLEKVSESFNDDDEKIVALLHDLVEDTSFTFDDLRSLGFSEKVISSLEFLTNDMDNYDDYIDRLIKSDNVLAKRVKMADLLDNMNLNRLKRIEQKDIDRIRNKYINAYMRLIDDLEKNLERRNEK